MTTASHPFSRDRVSTVAEEYGVDVDDANDALDRIQDAIARGDGEYEYSSEHNYGWRDEEAYYLYGDGIWETLGHELDLSGDRLDAAREVHRQAMLDSAEARGERETVAEMFEDSEPLVVTDTADEPPLYGQDV
ncbi:MULTISPECIES: hypothetical protein [Halorussus]|uniref:hypothetical protein n=1 Tax=Halorussus TaxID=1070314 RepID=UPI0020A1F223|nr:hypothetical protein [Halorussus vallis]USZ78027.1 hypothetical protein NGM07_20405 [Halorussus vallis]